MSRVRITSSIALALAIILIIAAWMASGWLSDGPEAAVPGSGTVPPKVMTVQAERLEPHRIDRMVTVQGELEPLKTATLRAEALGQVEKIPAERGDAVRKGQVLVQLKMNDRTARLKQAESLVRQRETEYRARQDLVREGFIERIAEKEAFSSLESARAALETIRLEIEHTTIRAPFDGILENRVVEVGDTVAVNDPVGLLVDTSSLIAAGQVPQQEIEHVRTGNKGAVRLITGQQAQGTVRYVASMPDKATQTFRIELEIENSSRSLPSGVSAEIMLPLEQVDAHFLSPAALVLGQDGIVGVKTVDADGWVGFEAVRTVRAQNDGIWVAGLEGTVSVIVSGQGFVTPGEQVNVVYREAGAPASAVVR
jgi:membrane fusion protein, multidrug efflux system